MRLTFVQISSRWTNMEHARFFRPGPVFDSRLVNLQIKIPSRDGKRGRESPMNDLDALKTHNHPRLRLLFCACCLDPFIFSCWFLHGMLRRSSALLSLGHSGEVRCGTGAYCTLLAPQAIKDNDNHVCCRYIKGFEVLFRMSFSGIYLLWDLDGRTYIKRRGLYFLTKMWRLGSLAILTLSYPHALGLIVKGFSGIWVDHANNVSPRAHLGVWCPKGWVLYG